LNNTRTVDIIAPCEVCDRLVEFNLAHFSILNVTVKLVMETESFRKG
jgi:hypothetical protein